MIIRKMWRKRRYKNGVKMYCYEGWFLLNIIPIYVKRLTVYT